VPQLDFAFEDEGSALPWLCGLQQLISFFAPVRPPAHLTWTMPKLRIQKLRLKLTGEVEDTNKDVVSASHYQPSSETCFRLRPYMHD
jgi:hypothetical protein